MTEVTVSYGRGSLGETAGAHSAPYLPPHIVALVESKKGIFLDVGCSDHKMAGSVGMDKRALPGVDILHDLEVLPWPLPDACCWRILGSHVWEHLKPWLMVDIMNECWRVMKEDGQLCLAMPYPGSPRFYMDPTHVKSWNEVTPQYFSPAYQLYEVYRPKPWRIDLNEWNSIGDLKVILSKIPETPST